MLLLLTLHLLLMAVDRGVVPVLLLFVELSELDLLLLELVLSMLQLLPVPLFLGSQILPVLLIQILQLLVPLVPVLFVLGFSVLFLLDPLLFPLCMLILDVCHCLLGLHHLALVLGIELVSFVEMLLLKLCPLLLLLIHLGLLLLDGGRQVFLVLLFCLSVFFDASRVLVELGLELFTLLLALSDQLLVLGDVLFQIIENLEFLIEGDQSVELVLRLDIFFFAQELELCRLPLLEETCSEALGDDLLCYSAS